MFVIQRLEYDSANKSVRTASLFVPSRLCGECAYFTFLPIAIFMDLLDSIEHFVFTDFSSRYSTYESHESVI